MKARIKDVIIVFDGIEYKTNIYGTGYFTSRRANSDGLFSGYIDSNRVPKEVKDARRRAQSA